MIKKLLISIFVSTLLCYSAYGWESKDLVTYFGTSDKEITIAWDAVENADYYELKLFSIERNVESVVANNISQTQLKIFLPRSGLFIVRARACSNSVGFTCSEWSTSDNQTFATVDGQPKGWWVYGYLAPPGPIIID